MSDGHPAPIRIKRDQPQEVCRRRERPLDGEYRGLYSIGPDRRPVCFLCFELERLAAQRAAEERATRCSNLVGLVAYRERRKIQAPVNAS